jgi:hypothetical protein
LFEPRHLPSHNRLTDGNVHCKHDDTEEKLNVSTSRESNSAVCAGSARRCLYTGTSESAGNSSDGIPWQDARTAAHSSDVERHDVPQGEGKELTKHNRGARS